MPNFDALNDATFDVELITLQEVKKVEVREGMTIKEFKSLNGISSATLIDEDSNRLRDNDVLEEGMQIYVSTPKKNG